MPFSEITSHDQKLDRATLERVAMIFRAFGEPTRLAILQELKENEKSVNELVASIDSSQANVSKQLRILFDAGLLRREKRGTQVFYSLGDEIVMPICNLVCDKLRRDAASTLGVGI